MLSGGSAPLPPHTLRSPEDFDKIFTLQNIFLLTKGRYASHCGVDLACQICTLCVTWPGPAPSFTTFIKVNTWSSCMAHCLPPMGLCQRQKNQGEEEEQERVRGEPSLVIVPDLGNLDTISIPLASSPLKIRRRGRRRGNENVMLLTQPSSGGEEGDGRLTSLLDVNGWKTSCVNVLGTDF